MPYLGRVPSPGWKRACNFISHPEMWKDGLGGGGDQVSAISHEAAGLCPDPYSSTGLAQLIKVTPSPPTSTPYLRRGRYLTVCNLALQLTTYSSIYQSFGSYFQINGSIVLSIKCQKILQNARLKFPKNWGTSLKCLFCLTSSLNPFLHLK